MNIIWIIDAFIILVWLYVIYILTNFLFFSFRIKYLEENPDKNTFKIPMVSLAVGVLVLLTWLIKPDPIRGHEEHLLMLFVPLFILDGLLPFFMRKKIYFSKRYIFRHEDFTRYIPTKRISRVERKRESLSIIDHQSISPMFKFYKKDYSKKDWIALNEFFDKFHHSKIVEFY